MLVRLLHALTYQKLLFLQFIKTTDEREMIELSKPEVTYTSDMTIRNTNYSNGLKDTTTHTQV